MSHRANTTSHSSAIQFNERNIEPLDTQILAPSIEFRRWQTKPKTVSYLNEDCHTLSFYIRGGENSFRCDQRTHKGGPGYLCLMPQSHLSEWQVANNVEFAHIYISDSELKYFATEYLEVDARHIELRDVTYGTAPDLIHLFKLLLVPSFRSDNLAVEQLSSQLLFSLLKHYNRTSVRSPKFTGGLTQYQRKTIKQAIHDKLDQKLTLASLSKEIGLSQFHFAREFKTSFGITPAQYINRTRIEKAKLLLRSHIPIAQISEYVGYSQQSHLTSSFKKAYHLTPAKYRAITQQ